MTRRRERISFLLASLVGPEPTSPGALTRAMALRARAPGPPAGETRLSPLRPLSRDGLDLGCTEYRTDYGRP